MLDRIKRMAEEAGGMFDPDFYDIKGGDRTMWLLQPHELERFAKAVARECAEIAAQTTEYGALDEHGETKAYATEAAIRARYGIKE